PLSRLITGRAFWTDTFQSANNSIFIFERALTDYLKAAPMFEKFQSANNRVFNSEKKWSINIWVSRSFCFNPLTIASSIPRNHFPDAPFLRIWVFQSANSRVFISEIEWP